MKFIKPSSEILSGGPSIEDMYKHIEYCGRIAYKSEDLITPESSQKFIKRIIDSKHYSVLEHGTVHLKFDSEGNFYYQMLLANKYSKFYHDAEKNYHVVTNMRVLVEHSWEEALEYWSDEPLSSNYARFSVRFILDRATAQEFTRHRAFSYTMESQRYCNYSKDKFGNEITFILPIWVSNIQNKENLSYADLHWSELLIKAEQTYFKLLELGWEPEKARSVLPNATKTELIMTGYLQDWKHFFNLRALGTTGKPHPEAQRLALPLMEEFKNKFSN